MTQFLPKKNMIQALITLVVLLILSSGYGTIACASGNGEATGHSKLTVNVDVTSHKQAIHGFGASDAWSIQFVGKNWPIEKRERIANLLFSTSTDSGGNPEGIGLSIWRFNIGAGSAAQGEASGIKDEWRRAEGFMQSDLTYDW